MDPEPAKNRGDHAITPREVEVERCPHRGSRRCDEELLQACARTKQTRLDRTLLDAEARRHLGALHALDGAQDEDRPVLFGQRSDCLFDQAPHLDVARPLLRVPRGSHRRRLILRARIERVELFAARELASVAVLLAAGVWADRVRRERMMIGSNVVSFAAQGVTGLLLVSGSAQLGELLLFQAIAGGADGAFNPARNAITPQVVSPARLQEANALLG